MIGTMRTRLFTAVALVSALLLTTSGCSTPASKQQSATATQADQATHVVFSVPKDEDGVNDASQSWSSFIERASETIKKKTRDDSTQISVTQEKSLHDQAEHLSQLAQMSSHASSSHMDNEDDSSESSDSGSSSDTASDSDQRDYLRAHDVLFYSPAVAWETSSLFSPLVTPNAVTSQPQCPVDTTSTVTSSSSSTGTKSNDAHSTGAKGDATGTGVSHPSTSHNSRSTASAETTRDKYMQAKKEATLNATHDSDCEQISSDVETIATALSTLKKHSIFVVAIGTNIGTTTPNVLVRTSDPRHIGQQEARHLVDKIQLDRATRQNPRAILIVLPSDQQATKSLTTGPSQTQQILSPATHDYLRGVLDVLSRYFTKSTAYNAYDVHLTDPDSPKWSNLVVPVDALSAASRLQKIFDTCRQQIASASSSSGPLSQDRLLGRLSHVVLGTGDIVPLSGILAGDDTLSQLTVSELTSRGYTGSASDINPQITLGGILGTIGKSPDVSKQRVPDPSAPMESQSTDTAKAWPIVVGFGANSKNAAFVTDGRQWATGVVNEQKIATTLTTMVTNVRSGKSLTKGISVSRTKVSETSQTQTTAPKATGLPATVQTITTAKARALLMTPSQLLFADNVSLKSRLVDGGYISAADAGI